MREEEQSGAGSFLNIFLLAVAVYIVIWLAHSETCAPGKIGATWYGSASGTLYYCDGSAWKEVHR